MPTIRDPRSLVGSWRLARVIDDALALERSEVTGRLELTPVDAATLCWQESGQWRRSAGVVDVARRLRVHRGGEGWWVLFEDGSPFHPWTPGIEVVHPCGRDTYRGLVSGTTQRWTIRWDVEGPAKDYSMTSVLTPGP